MVRPILEYALIIWCLYTKMNVDFIEAVQDNQQKLTCIPEMINRQANSTIQCKEIDLQKKYSLPSIIEVLDL